MSFGSSSPGLRTGWGHYVVFLGEILYSHSASLLHPDVKVGIGKFSAVGNPGMEKHLIQGGVEILLVALCYGNRSKVQPDWPQGLNTDLWVSSRPCSATSNSKGIHHNYSMDK